MKMAPPHCPTEPIGFEIQVGEYAWKRKYRNVFTKMLPTHFQAHKTQKPFYQSGQTLGQTLGRTYPTSILLTISFHTRFMLNKLTWKFLSGQILKYFQFCRRDQNQGFCSQILVKYFQFCRRDQKQGFFSQMSVKLR